MDKRMTRWEPGVDFGKLVSLFSSNKKDTRPSKPPQPDLPSFSSASQQPQPKRNQAIPSNSSQYATASSSGGGGSRVGRAGAGTPNSSGSPMRQPEAFIASTSTSSSGGYPAANSAADRQGKGAVGFGGRDGRPDPRALGPAARSPLAQNPSFPPDGQAGPGPNSNTNSRMDNRPPITQNGGLSPASYPGKGKAREDSAHQPARDLARKPLAASSFAEREAQMGQQRRQQETSNPDGLPIRNNRDVRVPVPEIRVTEPHVSVERDRPGREQRARVQQSAAAKLVEIPGRGVDDRRQNLRDDNSSNSRSKHDLIISAAQKASAAPQPPPPSSYIPVESGQRVPNRSELAAHDLPLPRDMAKTPGGAPGRVDYKLDTRTNRLVPVSAERPQESRTRENSIWGSFPQAHNGKGTTSPTVANVMAEEPSRSKAKGKQKEEQGDRLESHPFAQTAVGLVADQVALRRPERPAAVSESSRNEVDPRAQKNPPPPSAAQRQPENRRPYQTPHQEGRFQATNAEPVPPSLRPSPPQRDPASAGRERSFADRASAAQQRAPEPLPQVTVDVPAPVVSKPLSEKPRSAPGPSERTPVFDERQRRRPANDQDSARLVQGQTRPGNKARETVDTQQAQGGSQGNPQPGITAYGGQFKGVGFRQGRERPRVEIPQDDKSPYQAFKPSISDRQGASHEANPGPAATREGRGAQKTPVVLREDTTGQDSPKPLSLGTRDALAQMLRRETGAPRVGRGTPQGDSPLGDSKRYHAFSPVGTARPSLPDQRTTEVLGARPQKERREAPRNGDRERSAPEPSGAERKAAAFGQVDTPTRGPEAQNVPGILSPGPQQRDNRRVEAGQQSALSKPPRARETEADRQQAPLPTTTREAVPCGASRDARPQPADHGRGVTEQQRGLFPGILAPGQRQRQGERVAEAVQVDARGSRRPLQSRLDGADGQDERAGREVSPGEPSGRNRLRPSGTEQQGRIPDALAPGSRPRSLEKGESRDAGAPSSYTKPEPNEASSVRRAADPLAPKPRSLDQVQQPTKPIGPPRGGHVGVFPDQKTSAAQPVSSGAATKSMSPLAALERMAERGSLPGVQTRSRADQDFGGSRDASRPREEDSFDVTRKPVSAAATTSVDRPQRTETFAGKDNSRALIVASHSDPATRSAPQASMENADKGQPSRPPLLHVLAESQKRPSQEGSTPVQHDADAAYPPNDETKHRDLVGFSPAVLEHPVKELTVRAPPRPQHAVLVTKSVSHHDATAHGSSTPRGDRMAAARASVVPDVVQIPWSERYLPAGPQRPPAVPNVLQPASATAGSTSKALAQSTNTPAGPPSGLRDADDGSTSGTPVASHRRGFWDLYAGSSSKHERPAAPATPPNPPEPVQGANVVPSCLLVPSPTGTSPPTPFGRKVAAGSGVTGDPAEKGLELSRQQMALREELVVPQVPVLGESKLPPETATAPAETRELVFPFSTPTAQDYTPATLTLTKERQPDLPGHMKQHRPVASSTSASAAVSDAVPVNSVTLAEDAAASGRAESSRPTDAKSRRKSNRMASMYGARLHFDHDAPMPSITPTDDRTQSPPSRSLDLDTFGGRQPALTPEADAANVALPSRTGPPEPRPEGPSTDGLLATDNPSTSLPPASTPTATGPKVGRPATPKPSRVAHGSLLAADAVPPTPGADEPEPLRRSQLPAPLSLKVSDAKEAGQQPRPVLAARPPALMETKDARPSSPVPLDGDGRGPETQHRLSTPVSIDQEEGPRGPHVASSAPPPPPAIVSDLQNLLGDIFKNKPSGRADMVSPLVSHEMASSASAHAKSDKEAGTHHDGKPAEMATRSTAAEGSRTLSFPTGTVVGREAKAGEATGAQSTPPLEAEDKPSPVRDRVEPATRNATQDENVNLAFDPESARGPRSLPLEAEEKHGMSTSEPSVPDGTDELSSSFERSHPSMTNTAFVTGNGAHSRPAGPSSTLPRADQDERSAPPRVGGQETSSSAKPSMEVVEATVDSSDATPRGLLGAVEDGLITPALVPVSQPTPSSKTPDGLDSTADQVELHELEPELPHASLDDADGPVFDSPSPSHIPTTPAKPNSTTEQTVGQPFQQEEGHGAHSPPKPLVSVQDVVSTSELGIATQQRPDDENSTIMSSSCGKGTEACSPPEQPALHTPPAKEPDHNEVALASADGSHHPAAAVDTSRSAEVRSVGEPELLSSSGSGPRPVSLISESTEHLDSIPVFLGPESTNISPVQREDSFSLLPHGDTCPGDLDEVSVVQSNPDSGNERRESLSRRQPNDDLTTSPSSRRSPSPSLRSPTVHSRSIYVIDTDDGHNERHSSADDSDDVNAHDDGHVLLDRTCSAGVERLVTASPPPLPDGRDASAPHETMDHDVADAHQASSTTDPAHPEETRAGHLSRDIAQTIQSSDEDTATEPLGSSPRLQHRMPSNDAMSARTSVDSTSVVVGPAGSMADEDGMHKPAVSNRRDSSEEPLVSGSRHLSEDLSSSPDEDDRMAHWLRGVHSPEPSETRRPRSIADSENDHDVDIVQSWLHRISTPVEESRAASPGGLDWESHRAVASRSPDDLLTEHSRIPSPGSEVSSDDRGGAASEMGTAHTSDRPASHRDETAAQTSRDLGYAPTRGDSRRQSLAEPEASAPEALSRRRSCLVDTDASRPKQEDAAAEGSVCMAHDDELVDQQSPAFHNGDFDDSRAPWGPAGSFDDRGMDDKAAEHIHEEATSSPIDGPAQNAHGFGNEKQVIPDDHSPHVEEELPYKHEEEQQGLGSHGQSDGAGQEESPARAVDDDDAVETDSASNESTRNQPLESVGPSTPPTTPPTGEESPTEQEPVEDSKSGEVEDIHVPSESGPRQGDEEGPAPLGQDEVYEKLDGVENDRGQEEYAEAESPLVHTSGPGDRDACCGGIDPVGSEDHHPEEDTHKDVDLHDHEGGELPMPEDDDLLPDQEPEDNQHDRHEEAGYQGEDRQMILGGEEGDREMKIDDAEDGASGGSHDGCEAGDENGVANGPEDYTLDGLAHESEAPNDLNQEFSEHEPEPQEFDNEQVGGDRACDPEQGEAASNADEEHELDGFGARAVEDEDEEDDDRDLAGFGNGQNCDENPPAAHVDSQHDHTPEHVDDGDEDLGLEGGVPHDLDLVSEAGFGADEPGDKLDGTEPDDDELEIHEARELDDLDGASGDEIFSDGESLAEQDPEVSVESDQEEDGVPSEHEDGSQNGGADFLDDYNYSDTEEHQEPDLGEETGNQESIAADETSQDEEDRDVDMEDLYAVDIPSVPASPVEVQEQGAGVEHPDPVRLSTIYAQAPDFLSLDSPTSPNAPPEEATGDAGDAEAGAEDEDEEDPARRQPVRFSCLYRQSVDWEQALSSPVLRDLRSPTPEEPSSSFAVPVLDPVPGPARRASRASPLTGLAVVPEAPSTPVAAAAAASPLSPRPPATPPADDGPAAEHGPRPLPPARAQPTPPPDAEREGAPGPGCPRTFDEMDLAPRAGGPPPRQPGGGGDDDADDASASASIDLRALDAHRRSLGRRLSGWWSGGGAAGPSRARTPPPPLPYDSRYGVEEPPSPF